MLQRLALVVLLALGVVSTGALQPVAVAYADGCGD